MKWFSKFFLMLAAGILAFGLNQLRTSESLSNSEQRFKQVLAKRPIDSSTIEDTSIPVLHSELSRRARTIGFEPKRVQSNFGNLRLQSLKGETVQLSSYKNRWIILNFWASWCLPCRKEMPSLDRLQSKLNHNKYVVLTANVMEPKHDVKSFMREQNLTLPVLLDKEGQLAEKFRIAGLPVTWILTPGGKPLMRLQGDHKWDRGTLLTLLQNLSNNDAVIL